MIRQLTDDYRGKLPNQLGHGFILTADMCVCSDELTLCQWEVEYPNTETLVSITIEGVEYLPTNPTEDLDQQIRNAYLQAGYYEDGAKDCSELTITDDGTNIKVVWKDVPTIEAYTTDAGAKVVTEKCTPTVLCTYQLAYVPDNGVTQTVLTVDGVDNNIPAHEAGVTDIDTIKADFAAVLVAPIELIDVVYTPATMSYAVTIEGLASTVLSLTSSIGTQEAVNCGCDDGYIA